MVGVRDGRAQGQVQSVEDEADSDDDGHSRAGIQSNQATDAAEYRQAEHHDGQQHVQREQAQTPGFTILMTTDSIVMMEKV